MKRKNKKEFHPCACGCGQMVRYFPSNPRKFYNRDHYEIYRKAFMALFYRKNVILRLLDGKKTV